MSTTRTKREIAADLRRHFEQYLPLIVELEESCERERAEKAVSLAQITLSEEIFDPKLYRYYDDSNDQIWRAMHMQVLDGGPVFERFSVRMPYWTMGHPEARDFRTISSNVAKSKLHEKLRAYSDQQVEIARKLHENIRQTQEKLTAVRGHLDLMWSLGKHSNRALTRLKWIASAKEQRISPMFIYRGAGNALVLAGVTHSPLAMFSEYLEADDWVLSAEADFSGKALPVEKT